MPCCWRRRVGSGTELGDGGLVDTEGPAYYAETSSTRSAWNLSLTRGFRRSSLSTLFKPRSAAVSTGCSPRRRRFVRLEWFRRLLRSRRDLALKLRGHSMWHDNEFLRQIWGWELRHSWWWNNIDIGWRMRNQGISESTVNLVRNEEVYRII